MRTTHTLAVGTLIYGPRTLLYIVDQGPIAPRVRGAGGSLIGEREPSDGKVRTFRTHRKDPSFYGGEHFPSIAHHWTMCAWEKGRNMQTVIEPHFNFAKLCVVHRGGGRVGDFSY